MVIIQIIVNHSKRSALMLKNKKEPSSALLKALFTRVPKHQSGFYGPLVAQDKDQKLAPQKLT
ncbi:MAG: hypothetical protein UT32_C0001G0022 [Parcubacteria group bacterium GW2011_GWC2_39_14]|nr:MAG: hypothetical protein UT32_C0001G0022 [Parcubacteria group bacterium GW2011_GWC2_39_14]KKR55446.1 MAG: hypothetical protein UT91_C0001G0021 [Parcubacteria group bacterium GW2011_GWA2_40_23]